MERAAADEKSFAVEPANFAETRPSDYSFSNEMLTCIIRS